MLFNTVLLGLGTSILSVILGVFLAFVIYKGNIYFKKFLGWFYLVPILIPPYIYALTWNSILPNWNLFQGLSGAVLVLSFSYFPFVTILTISGLNSIDTQLEEAARVSHSEWGVLTRVTLPLVLPYILAGGLLCFVFAVSDYGVPGLLQLNVYPVEIFIKFSAFYQHTEAALMAMPLVLITFCLILLQKHYMKKRSYVTITGGYKQPTFISLGKWRGLMSAIVIVIIAGIILIPLISLVSQAGGWSSYKMAIKTSYIEIGTSLGLAILAATLCVFISFFIAYIIEKSSLRIRGTVDIISVLPFAIPPTIIGIGLIRMWNRPITEFIYGSSFILMLAYITISSAFAIRVLCSNLKQVSTSLEEAALITKTNWLKRTKRILLPLLSPALKAAWAISFILCMRELGATLLVIPPGKETVPIKIYTLMHYGASRLVASLSIILLVLTIVPIFILNYVKIRKSH